MVKKVLFISHNGSVSGAPISLNILMHYFKSHTDWEIKLLFLSPGPLIPKAEKDFDSNLYFKYCRPRRLIKKLFFDSSIGLKPRLKLFLKILKLIPRQLKNELNIYRKYSSWSPDLVYSNTAVNGDVIKKLKLKAPILVHVRELNMALDTLNPMAEKTFIEEPNFYFAVSNAVKQNLIKRYKISSDKIKIAPVALEVKKTLELAESKSPTEIKQELNFPLDAQIIGGVGFVNHRKGPDIFFEIAKKWVLEHPDDKICFVWVGEGTDLNNYQELLQKENLEKRIKFIGLKKDIYPYINAFNVFLMTSRDDPFPRVNLESALFEAPIVAFSNSGGSCEFILSDAGASVDTMDWQSMYEAFERLMSDQESLKKMGKVGKQRVIEKYDVGIIAKNIVDEINMRFFNDKT